LFEGFDVLGFLIILRYFIHLIRWRQFLESTCSTIEEERTDSSHLTIPVGKNREESSIILQAIPIFILDNIAIPGTKSEF
jgi:hypothetical protein